MIVGMSDDEVMQGIGEAVRTKKAVLGGHNNAQELSLTKNRPMIKIGG
jgi:hypothetical protein